MTVPEFLIWHCAGCGAAADGKKKPCDCATNVGTRKGPNGKSETTWWDSPPETIASPNADLLNALIGLEAALQTDSRDKTITGDTVEYHLDGQAMYQAINKARTAIAAWNHRPTAPASADVDAIEATEVRDVLQGLSGLYIVHPHHADLRNAMNVIVKIEAALTAALADRDIAKRDASNYCLQMCETNDRLIAASAQLSEARAAHARLTAEVGLAAGLIASARIDEREECARTAEAVGHFGDYRREELTTDYGQPRYDLMHEITAAIRARDDTQS